ncbi:carboxymuconolactone decarboxylase family protein [Shewanella sp. D64]|uniref:carboxymuconolactone decarboxylase family protein n=1 Tax=unclassified Shewanella TaxID=196818 RepID=UPI0022BA518D|nr:MULTISPECIES: carboxymuconolactone decarboxylase family protein [unclassified Shewanella]MEC4726681.1 carboxymuconolactone decarboxylase family protein [Shewanella sp. D64]MEC4738955.1 carboxymuconolactone decarboxylase family protein [Shewanella sp. E94]WBJ96895.1 carboxymuconolactone decarboxylase family protein [Shewanella sp. MTB7]
MTDVIFKNTRFDPDLTPFHEQAKQMAKAFGYTADLDFDKNLAQLVRLRVAQVNQCSYCLILHTKTAREVGIDLAKIDNLASYWESELYGEQEKAALRYCDRLTHGVDSNFQEVHQQAKHYFSDKEMAELAAIVINMNLWTRLKLAQGATPSYAE